MSPSCKAYSYLNLPGKLAFSNFAFDMYDGVNAVLKYWQMLIYQNEIW